jgi:single-stranded-DNA-specific exonuclease
MRKWLEPEFILPPEDFVKAVGGNTLIARVLFSRGIKDIKNLRPFFNPEDYQPTSPLDLPDMKNAVDHIDRAIQQGDRICIWGDFDVDGQTATTVLVSGLRKLGGNVIFHIPVRERESHGISVPYLEPIIDDGIQMLLTCDTGITAHEAISYAQSRGVNVIITDHHDLPDKLPQALAVINPKRLSPHHPLAALPGVGVAYKLIEALFQKNKLEHECPELLDLVALGIVADVANLQGDNRYLLQQGLAALRKTGRVGLQVLMEMADLNPNWITEEHIGFILAPRLNALGRLDDANPAVELLTTSDPSRARVLAARIEALNARRKLLSNQVLQGALSQITNDPSILDKPALVLDNPAWEPGVIGIVASELVEKYNRPAILMNAPPDGIARASARSVEACDITAAIATQKDLLHGYGGHPMAAGFSIDTEKIPEFRSGLIRAIHKQLKDQWTEPTLKIDGYLPLNEITIDLVKDIERLSPFGPGNPPLNLATRNLHISSFAPVGRDGEHLQIIVEDELGNTQKVIWWKGAGWPLPEGQFDLAYSVRASNYRGQAAVQVEWIDARPILEETISIPKSRYEIIDYRQSPCPLPTLQQIIAQSSTPVWSEADALDRIHGQDRYSMTPNQSLIIWSTPPGRTELLTVLEKVQPNTIYLFAINPAFDSLEAFIKQLGGLIKFALKTTQGYILLSTLASKTGQREETVTKGLAWFEEHGDIIITNRKDDEIWLEAGSRRSTKNIDQITRQLKALLEETIAYRDYFQKTDANHLF